MYLDGDEWEAYFRDFKRSAFRLEVHQTYTMPGEAATFGAFLAGEPMPDGFNARWHQTIREHAAAGRTMTRAKIVRQPLTPYSRYSFSWGVPTNVAAGEDYRVIDLTDGSNPGLPEQDFWMFDETTVVHLNYRPDGTQINRELITGDITPYLEWKRIALAESVPFEQYAKGLDV
ncbi:DUF6879 family protein [Streptomyces dysideae]|uniref:DUF6879 domain-containing protein n=1 Tax=Streptomyces dysideae TaxID=909626 RepID=A0A101UY20_9ACTN|nr:DUF6879 family protein [Streptomyces dysideae]KUO19002.1 hypothetical protein AQJ91_22655 [Streptomyces dysideae]